MMVRYELKKVFARPGSWIALLVLLGLLFVTAFAAVDVTYANEEGEAEYGYAATQKLRAAQKEWAGVLDEEKLRAVIAENLRIAATPEAMSDDYTLNNKAFHHKQGFLEILYLIANSFSEGFQISDYSLPNRLSVEDAPNFYSNRIRLLTEWLYGDYNDYFSEAEKQYLIGQYEKLETPFYYDYMRGWTSFADYSNTMCMLIMIVLGFLLAGIFSNEFKWKSDAVFFAAEYGRDRAVRAKLLSGFIMITVIYWVTMLLYSAIVFGCCSVDGANCLIQADSGAWKSFYNITNLQKFALILLGGYLGCLSIGGMVMLVSAKSRSAVLAVMLPFVLLFIPSFLGNLNIEGLNKILALLPDRLLQIDYALGYFDLFQIGKTVMGAVPILFVLYAVVTVLLIPSIYMVYKRTELK